MTLPEFLEKLEQTPRDWYLLRDRIRRGDCRCPIVELAGRLGTYRAAGRSIGFTDELTDSVVAAADNDRQGWFGPFHPELRAKLLKACGLESA